MIVPKTLMTLDPDLISGRRIWVLVSPERETDHLLAEVGWVENVAEIEDETSKGDFILELDRSRTFKTLAPGADLGPWKVSWGASAALQECPPGLQEALAGRLNASLGTKLAPPSERPSAHPWTPLSGTMPLVRELALVNGTKSLSSLSAFRALPGL